MYQMKEQEKTPEKQLNEKYCMETLLILIAEFFGTRLHFVPLEIWASLTSP